MYGYKESMDRGVELEGVWEDSPLCLAHYRGIYDRLMARHRAEQTPRSTAHLCRMSLVTENLAIAAREPTCRDGILRKLLREIWRITGQEGGDNLYFDLVRRFADGSVGDSELLALRGGFNSLLVEEGL